VKSTTYFILNILQTDKWVFLSSVTHWTSLYEGLYKWSSWIQIYKKEEGLRQKVKWLVKVLTCALANGMGLGVWNERWRKEMVPGFPHSVSFFPVNFLWVFKHFNDFSVDMGMACTDVCYDFYFAESSTLSSL